ncbi:HAD-IA family hydrolase [Rugosimonospora africana]|uniref:Haloacid dehalogenase n=1 Tax=Rugosimonospora africana TaxID=556532 RepID=A0A8J3QNV5_9ACTN|nr:HAD-IA family hydrolase [Rugosimonospora africana]GIH13594.1 haloacid dehalogenase [Rugosimonospora africana]
MRPSRPVAAGLLIDMDGVLRRWDPRVPVSVEERYGLPVGTLRRTAFAPSRVTPAVTGQISHADWMNGVAEAIGEPAAVTEWETYRGEADPEVLEFVREVRAAGIRVGLATNATDRLDADLALLGLVGELDEVINSSIVGFAKPAASYFAAACARLGVPPRECLFVDDSERFVNGARAAGLSAFRWTGPSDLPYLRAALGLTTVSPPPK